MAQQQKEPPVSFIIIYKVPVQSIIVCLKTHLW